MTTYSKLVEDLQKLVDPAIVSVELVEDDDVRAHDYFVEGSFWPTHIEEDIEPITVEIITLIDADIDDAEAEAIKKEFMLTVNHEMVHLEQFNEGRFIFVWNGPYSENPNEIEAYFREDKMEFVNA